MSARSSTREEEIILKLLEPDFKELEEIINEAAPPYIPELAEAVTEFYIKHDVEDKFLEWIISKEVSETKNLEELFCTDNFASNVISRYLFGDLGKRYLATIASSLLENISCIVAINEEEPTSPELLSCVDTFLKKLKDNICLCPIKIRSVLYIINYNIAKYFPISGFTRFPFVLKFIFSNFFCKYFEDISGSQIDPHEGVLSTSSSGSSLESLPQSNLRKVSKVLQDIVNKKEEELEPEIREWAQQYHASLSEYIENLISKHKIDEAESIISSSYATKSPSKEEIHDTIETLKMSIHSIFYMNENEVTITDRKIMGENLLSEFEKKLKHPEWKKNKKGAIPNWVLKDKDSPIFSLKATTEISGTPSQIVDFIFKEQWANQYTPTSMFSEVIEESPDFEIRHFRYKLFFPFKDREMYIYSWMFKLNENHSVTFFDNAPEEQAFPRKSNLVRAQMYLSGWDIVKSGPNQCDVTMLIHVHPRGSLPKWAINSIIYTQLNKLKLLKQALDGKYA